MPFQYNPAEKVLRRDLRARIKVETDAVIRADITLQLQKIKSAAEGRATKRAAVREQQEAASEMPKWEKWDTSESFDAKMAEYRLTLKEAAAYEVLDNPKSGLRARLQAENELKRIERRCRELVSKSAPIPAVPTPPLDVAKMSDSELRNDFAMAKWFRANLGTSNGELIANLETEIRRRNLLLVWSVEGTNWSVNKEGEPVHNLTDTVYMGVISRAELPECTQMLLPSKAEPVAATAPSPTPTPAQSEYWNRGSKAKGDVVPPAAAPEPARHRAYMLLDGTMFYSDGEIITAVPRGVTVYAAADPPHYRQNSHVLPSDFVWDEINLLWRRR